MDTEPKRREGIKFVAEAKPGDRLAEFNGRIFILNPNEPLREILPDGTIAEVKIDPRIRFPGKLFFTEPRR